MWAELWRLARPHWRTFAVVMVLAACGTVAELVEPLIYRAAVNDVAGLFVGGHGAAPAFDLDDGAQPAAPPSHAAAPATKPSSRRGAHAAHHRREPHRRDHVAARSPAQAFRTLLWAVGLLLLTGVAARAFERASDDLSERVANGLESDLILRTFRHVLHMPLGFFGRRASGALARQIDQSDQVAPVVSAFTKEIVPEALRLIGIVGIMCTQNVPMTLIVLGTLPAYLYLARRAAQQLESDLPAYYELWEQLSSRIQDALGAVKTVKLAGAEEREVERVRGAATGAFARYLEQNRAANKFVFWQSSLAQVGKALVLGYGGWQVQSHRLTPGDVVMFVAYLDRLYDPIDSLTSLQRTLQTHAASLRRAFSLLAQVAVDPPGGPLEPGPGQVEVRDLHFGYVPEREVLAGVSFTVRAGATTAIVGPSGAGKTTLVDLLLRLYEPTSGTIAIDGQLLSTIAPAAVRHAVCVVAADGAVFRGTLGQNLRYFRPDASDAAVRDAALAAGLGRALDRLPQGLDTEIGEQGMGLSLGERQRLQIARVLLAEPRILVLDEATANLDYATECEVKEALARLRAGRTTLVIAHRFSMVADADHVVVLDGGRVVESGPPAELAAAGGWFARFAAATAGAEASEEAGVAADDEEEDDDVDETEEDDDTGDDDP